MPRLENKTAIVTGGANGIGAAIARLFAEEGARVIIADLDSRAGESLARTLSSGGAHALFVECDVAAPDQVRRTVETAVAGGSGTLDILCNNAAYLAKNWSNAADAAAEEWEKCVRISLLGAQHFIQAVLPFMRQQRRGSILNISSVQGLVAGRNSAAYTTVKHGLIGLTRSVACDFGPENIRCNAICPGAITTRISPGKCSELYQRQIAKTFLGRVGQPEEVARAALFLASDEASYVTGAVLAVDGGWTAM